MPVLRGRWASVPQWPIHALTRDCLWKVHHKLQLLTSSFLLVCKTIAVGHLSLVESTNAPWYLLTAANWLDLCEWLHRERIWSDSPPRQLGKLCCLCWWYLLEGIQTLFQCIWALSLFRESGVVVLGFWVISTLTSWQIRHCRAIRIPKDTKGNSCHYWITKR